MTPSRLLRPAAMLLVATLFANNFAFAAKKPADPMAMKTKIQAHGIGQGVRVSLADKTEAKGLIVAIGDKSFTLKTRKSADVRQIEYAQLTGVHNDHLTRGQKVAITAGVVAAGVVIAVVVVVVRFRNSFPGTIALAVPAKN